MSTSSRAAIAELTKVLDSTLLRVLAEPARIEILKLLLTNGSSDINGIADRVAQDRSVVSRHLKLMHEAGIVEVRKQGRHRFYSLATSELMDRLGDITSGMKAAIAACCPPKERR